MLPVSHARTLTEQNGQHAGIWFYYMRGCSDLLLDVGRTLIARNRCDAAILLEQRASQSSRSAALRNVARSAGRLRYGYNAAQFWRILQRARERLDRPDGDYFQNAPTACTT